MQTENLELLRVGLSELELHKNPRKDLKDIKGLAATIVAANGILQPLKGFRIEKEGGVVVYSVVDGQRRFTALNLLNELGEHAELVQGIPFLIMPEGMSESDIKAFQVLSNEGEPLTPLELGETIAEMINDDKLKISEVAEKLGKSKVYIAELKKLAEVPEYLKALIRKGTLSATLVREQIKAGTLEAFIANINENGYETGTDLPSQDITGEIEKQQASAGQKITASDLKVNSIKEFKTFSKGFSETFPNNEKQKVYEFATELVRNLLSYDDILNYFSDEKTAANDTPEKQHLREKANKATGRKVEKGLTAIAGGVKTAGTAPSATQPTTAGGEGQETAPKAENEAFDKLQSSLFGEAEKAEEITQPLMPEPVEVAAPAAAPKKAAAKKVAEAPKKAAPKKAAAKKEAAPKKVAAKKATTTAPSKKTIRQIGYDKQSGKIAE